jgi:hypothetical protein
MIETTVLWATGALNVLAIITAPITALWVQGRHDESKAQRLRRQSIFNALWVNRRRQFYIARVDALNLIDLEFLGEQKVLDAWQALFAHYSQPHPGMNDDQIFTEREELFATLLHEMSQVLGYTFSRTHIRDNIYRPGFHNKFDLIDMQTREWIHALLQRDALPVRFVTGTAPEAPRLLLIRKTTGLMPSSLMSARKP